MRQDITFPCFTSDVCRLVGTTNDKRLNDLVRSGRVRPAPPVASGRRLWGPEHIRQAAIALGVLTPELEQRLHGDESASLR